MTTKRRIKKEIDYIVAELILDCITYSNLKETKGNEEALQIVGDSLSLRNQLRNQANHPEKREGSTSVKAYYHDIANDLVAGVNNGYEKLGAIAGKKA